MTEFFSKKKKKKDSYFEENRDAVYIRNKGRGKRRIGRFSCPEEGKNGYSGKKESGS